MDEIILIILASIVVWIIIASIVGSFGKGKKIGFTGAFFASLFLSPILAMLFVLASDGKSGGKLSKGEKALIYIPILLCILIPFIIIGTENYESHKFALKYAKMNIEDVNNIDESYYEKVEGYDKKHYYRFKYEVKDKLPISFRNMIFEDINELELTKLNEIKRCNKIILQHSNLGLKIFFSYTPLSSYMY